jgi:ribosomal protein S18 acetylase RimI-like enzyme
MSKKTIIPGVTISVTTAKKEELAAIAQLFLEGFSGAIEAALGKIPRACWAESLAQALWSIEREGFILAREDNRVIGYIVVTRDLKGIVRGVLLRGYLLRWIWGWLSGRYGLGRKSMGRAFKGLFSFIGGSGKYRSQGNAQILSIAVANNRRGVGIGTRLVEEALKYLEKGKVSEVRLEVRPDNLPARRIYEKLGFVVKGTIPTIIGESLVMIKRLK